MSSENLLYITPYLKFSTRGYQVHIGKVVSLFFGSRTYGSDAEALTAALQYRDATVRILSLIKDHSARSRASSSSVAKRFSQLAPAS